MNQFAIKLGKSLDVDIHIIEGAFNLVMEGRLEEHNRIVTSELERLVKGGTRIIAVAQLSMVGASKNVDGNILNPLHLLMPEIINVLELDNR
ncbi:hypothetical protein JFL43_14760 [Viridibacillus sp. YIM B01967]|uniref:Uncharacterized protein n=1 Tax=Viridibacillus soli TaxID=2798301 RepID=A0ABS1H9V6_9BACL|nr:hypothetical protein [Viridibacillus soli]MBK3496101.1 hypothetical protein [Viridibacillus soli]